jgi:hypothetical protein
LENIVVIHNFLGHFIGKDLIQELTAVGRFEDYLSIDMSNCYFTPRRKGTLGVAKIPFSADVDPHGFLDKAGGTTLFYSNNNKVHYYERVFKENGDGYR